MQSNDFIDLVAMKRLKQQPRYGVGFLNPVWPFRFTLSLGSETMKRLDLNGVCVDWRRRGDKAGPEVDQGLWRAFRYPTVTRVTTAVCQALDNAAVSPLGPVIKDHVSACPRLWPPAQGEGAPPSRRETVSGSRLASSPFQTSGTQAAPRRCRVGARYRSAISSGRYEGKSVADHRAQRARRALQMSGD